MCRKPGRHRSSSQRQVASRARAPVPEAPSDLRGETGTVKRRAAVQVHTACNVEGAIRPAEGCPALTVGPREREEGGRTLRALLIDIEPVPQQIRDQIFVTCNAQIWAQNVTQAMAAAG